VSNEYLEDGVKELPTNVKKSLNDTRLFINNTKKVRNSFVLLLKKNEASYLYTLKLSFYKSHGEQKKIVSQKYFVKQKIMLN